MRSRFAPSPTGPLHAGSLVAALGSWLDARANNGKWLVRIEDIDIERNVPGADQAILSTLAAFGLEWDEAPVWQTSRLALYEQALKVLLGKERAYACVCSRKAIAEHGSPSYPGTCRGKQLSLANSTNTQVAWRFALPDSFESLTFTDRRLGLQTEVTQAVVGDFVIKRADKNWAYQLAVVVDDEDQGITDIVRGEDLRDSTARQIHLQTALGYRTPRYLHLPLVNAANGEKLSKQNQATALDSSSTASIGQALLSAALQLHLSIEGLNANTSKHQILEHLVKQWPYKLS